MSLMVYPYIRDETTGSMVDVEDSIPAPFNDLFGFESWRYKVWGSKVVEKLGCPLLITLKNTDIFAETADIDQLTTELLLLKNHLNQLEIQLNLAKNTLNFRIENALEAIKIAKKYPNGGVYIG